MLKLLKFKTKSLKDEHKLVDSSVSYVEEEDKVYIYTENTEPIDISECVASDILLYDINNNKNIIIKPEYISEYSNLSLYTPIGVVTVPASHNIYGDGSCAVMSLKPMSNVTPNVGGNSNTLMVWGSSFDAYPTTLYSDVVITDNEISNNLSVNNSSSSYYMPNDISNSSIKYVMNDYLTYNNSCTIGTNTTMSQYNSDGTINTLFFDKTLTTLNALSDVNGRYNCDKMLEYRGDKDYSSWKPSGKSDIPCVSTCDMFYTDGTSQGDWYLPALGELTYISAKLNEINNTLALIKETYGSNYAVELKLSGERYYYYSSSTQHSNGHHWVYILNSGAISGSLSGSSLFSARAFLRVK